MMAELTDILDIASDRVLTGEPMAQVAADYPNHWAHLEPLLGVANALVKLQAVEMPPPAVQAADRSEFLAQWDRLEASPVSLGLMARLKGWYARYRNNIQMASPLSKKEAQPMHILLAKAAVIFTLAFGALGGSAAAVANSLPDSPVYGAKLALEEFRLGLTNDPGRTADLHVDYALARSREIEALAMDDRIANEALVGQIEYHLNKALTIAAGLQEQAMQRVLERTRERTRAEVQALVQLQEQVREQTRLRLLEAERLMVQAREQAQLGLEDPAQFRWQHQHQEGQPETPPAEQHRNGAGAGEQGPHCEDCEPAGDQNKYGQDSGQYGPGGPNSDPGCADCEPSREQHQNGSGSSSSEDERPATECEECTPVGDEHHYGPQPEQPGPGEPGGNADPTCTDCEPVGDEHQYGPQPDQPGPGGPDGNGESTCTDCEPAGDENQYGPQPDQPGPGGPGGAEDPPCSDCEPTGDANQHQGPDGGDSGGAVDNGSDTSGGGGSDDSTGGETGSSDGGSGSPDGGTDSSGTGTSGDADGGSQGGSGGRSG